MNKTGAMSFALYIHDSDMSKSAVFPDVMFIKLEQGLSNFYCYPFDLNYLSEEPSEILIIISII